MAESRPVARSHPGLGLVLGAFVLAAGAPASAEPGACAATLRRESARVARAAADAIGDCAAAVATGALPAGVDCHPTGSTGPAIGAAAFRARARVAAACCGADRTCGTGDDDPLAAVGWTAGSCPDLARSGCTAATGDAGAVADCLACAGTAAAALGAEVVTGRFAPTPSASALARCQAAIAAASARLFGKRTKRLRACWDRRARGLHANPCPDPGDGRAAAAIARAERAFQARLCRECGGTDRRCGGGDDLLPPTIGVLAACPDVVPPGGLSCAQPVATLADLGACVACVTAFAAGCADRLASPALTSYPPECTPATGTCSAGTECETSLDCPTAARCRDNGGGTRYCVGAPCAGDGDCAGGSVCRPYCTVAGCGGARCQCPGFGCAGPDEICLDAGGLACHRICTQDSDCVDPFGLVCINPGFGFGACIGTIPCQ
jgi:hypothetical protein